MNYNNFACRLTTPRPVNLESEKVAPPVEPKKPRKPVRRRLAAPLVAICALVWMGGVQLHAGDVCALPVVPAPGIVLFSEGLSGADVIDESEEVNSPGITEVLAGRMEAVAAEVVSATKPAPAHASALTVVLICGGLGMAGIQAARILRCGSLC